MLTEHLQNADTITPSVTPLRARPRTNVMGIKPEGVAILKDLFRAAYPKMRISNEQLLNCMMQVQKGSNTQNHPIGLVVQNKAQEDFALEVLKAYSDWFENFPVRPQIGMSRDAAGRTRIHFDADHQNAPSRFLGAMAAALKVDSHTASRILNNPKHKALKPSSFGFDDTIFDLDAMFAENTRDDGSAFITRDQFKRYFPHADIASADSPEHKIYLLLEHDAQGIVNVPSGSASRERHYAHMLSATIPRQLTADPRKIYSVHFPIRAQKDYPRLFAVEKAIGRAVFQQGGFQHQIYCISIDPKTLFTLLGVINPDIKKSGQVDVKNRTISLMPGPARVLEARLNEIAEHSMQGNFEAADAALTRYWHETSVEKLQMATLGKSFTEQVKEERAAAALSSKPSNAYEDEINAFMLPLAGLEPILDLRDRLKQTYNTEDFVRMSSSGERRLRFDSEADAQLAQTQLLRLLKKTNSEGITVRQDTEHKRKHWVQLKEDDFKAVMAEGDFLRDWLAEIETTFESGKTTEAHRMRSELRDYIEDKELTRRHSAKLKSDITTQLEIWRR